VDPDGLRGTSAEGTRDEVWCGGTIAGGKHVLHQV
jgi:hypothetical protein